MPNTRKRFYLKVASFVAALLFIFTFSNINTPEYRRITENNYYALKDLKRDHVVSGDNFAMKTRQSLQLEQSRRIRHLLDACAESTLFSNQTYRAKNDIIYYFAPKYNFNYCKVPKVGSTFWTQVFTVLKNGSEAAKNIFEMNRDYVTNRLIWPNTVEFNSEERRRSRSILISRDPYSRLYSAYIDKMYLQGLYHEAAKIAKNQRNLPKDEFTCASDISFQEFLNDIVESVKAGESLNRHWAPIVSICKPCDIDVLVLIKYESFSSDVEYSLNELGISRDEFEAITDALHDHRLEDTLPGMIEITLTPGNNGCKTKLDMARRIWTSFQIQGFLNDGIPFPSDVIDTDENATSELLINLVMKIIREYPLTPEESKTQRRRALVKAYQHINRKTLDELKKVYEEDFVLFNYSFEPPSGL